MIISIQPLDTKGNPTDKSFTSDWLTFLDHNDGFSIQEVARMRDILMMGSGYLLGGGAAGSYRLSMIRESGPSQ
jgi:hypothetical protein